MIDLNSARSYALTSTNILLMARQYILNLCNELEAERARSAKLQSGLIDSLNDHKDDLGQAASDWLTKNDPNGLDWCDSRNVDELVGAMIKGITSNTPASPIYAASIKEAKAEALEQVGHMFRYQQYSDFTERDKGFKEAGIQASQALYDEAKQLRFAAKQLRGLEPVQKAEPVAIDWSVDHPRFERTTEEWAESIESGNHTFANLLHELVVLANKPGLNNWARPVIRAVTTALAVHTRPLSDAQIKEIKAEALESVEYTMRNQTHLAANDWGKGFIDGCARSADMLHAEARQLRKKANELRG